MDMAGSIFITIPGSCFRLRRTKTRKPKMEMNYEFLIRKQTQIISARSGGSPRNEPNEISRGTFELHAGMGQIGRLLRAFQSFTKTMWVYMRVFSAEAFPLIKCAESDPVLRVFWGTK